MTIWVDVDIALASVPVNAMPLIDATDFKTIEDALTYNQAGLALFWNFTTTSGVTTVTAVTPTTAGTHDWTDFTTSGMYGIAIPASGGASISNDTEGFGFFTGMATGVLPWRGPEIGFRAAAVNVALVTAGDPITARDLGEMYESDIATVTSQTQFIMTSGIASDDAYIGNTISVQDISTGETVSRYITDVVQSTETIHINAALPFTVVSGDIIRIYATRDPSYAATLYDAATGTEVAANLATILAKLLAYVRVIVRKDAGVTADQSVEIAAIVADEGSGAGTWDHTVDSLEAQADVSTEVRLAELDAGNLVTDIANAAAGVTNIQNRIPNALSAGGYMKGATLTVNGRVITGTGVPTTDPWLGGAAE
jgi:hypothetical protein